MFVRKQMIPRKSGAEVEPQHFTVLALVDTTFGKYGDWQCIGVIRIYVEPVILFTDSGIIQTATVGYGLIGIIQYIMFL